jgi:hypothetical protein
LFTTRCSHPLCNTQHTTTPQPTTTTTTPTRRALDGPGQEQPEKTPTVSPQDPTVCRTQEPKSPHNHEPIIMFHPATPQNTGHGIKEKENQPPQPQHPEGHQNRAGQPTSPHGETP